MSDQEFIPRVFISYAWESPGHKRGVLDFADRLRADGVEAWIDEYDAHQPDPWPRWMNRQIEAAHRVLMIFTPTYRARFEGDDTPGGHGVNHEGLVIQQHLYNAKGKNGKFRAVLLGEATRDCLSVDVAPYTCYQPDDPLGYEDLVRWLYGAQRVTAAPLGKKPGFLDPLPPGVARVESVRGISELYRRTRDQLIRQCQSIPVFGQVMADIPMAKNFVKLRLTLSSGAVDDGRRAHGAFPRFDESRDLRQAGGKRKWADEMDDEMGDDEPFRQRPGRLALDVPELWAHYPKAAILGLPGAGKTTILRHFVYLATRLREMPLVLFIACRSLRSAHFGLGDDPDGFRTAAAAFLYPSMGDLGADEEDRFHPAAGDGAGRHTWTQDQLEEIDHLARHLHEAVGKNQLVMLVDAFDETLEPLRKPAETWLSALMRAVTVTADAPGNRCYFSARRHEIERFRSVEAPVFEVDPLNQDQMRDFARALYGADSDTYQAFDAIVWREPVMQKMGRTPLTALLLLCYFDVHQRFDTRFHTYDLLLKFVLLNVWESIKRRRFTRDADRMRRWFIECAAADFEENNDVVMMRYRALGSICHLLLYDSAESPGGGSREASEKDLLRAFEKAMTKEENPGRKALDWLADFRKANLLVATGPRTYVFVHSTLMEYLAAWHLCHVPAEEREDTLKQMCSLAFDSLDSLAIACGHAPETNLWLFPLLDQYLIPTYYPSSSAIMQKGEKTSETLSVPHSMQTLFRCVAEAESMEYGLIMSYTVRSYREDKVRELEPCVQARTAAYQHLTTLVNLADETTVKVWLAWLTGKPQEEILEILSQHSYTHIPDSQYLELGLSRGEVFPERFFPEWWGGDGSALDWPQTALLCLMLKKDLRFQWYMKDQARFSQSVSATRIATSKLGSVLPRTLDQPGDPQDRDFGRYRGICGEDLAGMLGSPNLRHGAPIHALAVHPHNRHRVFTAGNDCIIRLWDTASGREIRSFAGHTRGVTCCALDAAGERLISGSADQTLKLWELASGREIRSFTGHAGSVTCCALDAVGERLISGSDDKTLALWELASGREIRSFAGHSGYVTCCALDAAGERLISGSYDRALKLWEVASGREIRSFVGHTNGVTCCALDAAGERLISGSVDHTLKLWELASGREIRSFAGHAGHVTCCTLDAAGERLISGSWDRTLKLWELASGREIRSFAGHKSTVTCCALDAGGGRLISGAGDKTLKLWELASGREIRSFAGHTDWVTCCALDAAGERLISGSRDQTLKLWDTETGRELHSWNLPHPAHSLALKLAPPKLWLERPHDRPTQVLSVGLSNGVVLLFDLTEWL